MRRRLSLWPNTTTGWYAVLLAALAMAWVFLGRAFQASIRPAVCPGRLCTGGREFVAVAIVLGALASTLGLVAIVRRGERALVAWLTVVPATLLTVFWLIFGAAEVLFPH